MLVVLHGDLRCPDLTSPFDLIGGPIGELPSPVRVGIMSGVSCSALVCLQGGGGMIGPDKGDG
jgi:hypothetical protein